MKHEREDYNERVVCTDGSIPEDEPVFLLRGKDPQASEVIRFWVVFSKLEGAKKESVLAHADKMEKYSKT